MTVFSNATEFELWTFRYCNRCVNDEMGSASLGTFCPILDDVIIHNEDIPVQWEVGEGFYNYHCTEFEQQ
jgi:hypothetical protein